MSTDFETGADHEPLFHEVRKIKQAGGGLSVHIPKAWAEAFSLSAGNDVQIDAVERDGRVEFIIRPNQGFHLHDLKDYAAASGWAILEDLKVDDISDRLLLAYQLALVRADGRPRVGRVIIRNVRVEGPPFRLNDTQTYARFQALAKKASLELWIDDREGLWARLTGAGLVSPGIGIPDKEEVDRYLQVVPHATIRFGLGLSSMGSKVQDVASAVKAINARSLDAKSFANRVDG